MTTFHHILLSFSLFMQGSNAIRFTSVTIEPCAQSRLTDPLSVLLTINSPAEMSDCRIECAFVLDIAVTQTVVPLSIKDGITLKSGCDPIEIRIDSFSRLQELEKRLVKNVGTLSFNLRSNNESDQSPVAQLELVVSIEEKNNELVKTIFSPFQ